MFKRSRVNHEQITSVTRQLATLIDANVPILQCCTTIMHSTNNDTIRVNFYWLREQILSGNNLHDSLTTLGNFFDVFSCQLIKLGEQTGKLAHTLDILANIKEQQLKLKNQITQAVIYPLLLVIMAILIFFSMFIFIIPRFAELFSQQHSLPMMTKAVFQLSVYLRNYLWLVGLFVLALTLYLHCIDKLTLSTQKIMGLIFKLSILKKVRLLLSINYFTQQLYTAVSAGMPIHQALRLIKTNPSLHLIAEEIHSIHSEILAGTPLHESFASKQIFPAMVVQMINIGENTGSLEPALLKSSEHLQSSINKQISLLTQLLEPLIMVVLGVLIGGLVIAMYLPVFNLGTTV